MAWQTPKTDWDTNPKNPKAEDMNRIEENIDFLKNDIETKKGLIVDSINTNLGGNVTIANTHQELADAMIDLDLVSANIKSGVNIFGVSGKPSVVDTDDANAVAAQILLGKTAYVNGSKVTGSIPSKAAATITPGTTNQIIAAGQYLSGNQTIAGDADLLAENIKSGKDVFGVVGSLIPLTNELKWAEGMANGNASNYFAVTGLDFTPKIILIKSQASGNINDPLEYFFRYMHSDVIGVTVNWYNTGSTTINLNVTIIPNSNGFEATYARDSNNPHKWVAIAY